MTDLTPNPAVDPEVDFVPLSVIGESSLLPQIHAVLDEAGIAHVVTSEGVRIVFGLEPPAFGAPVLCVEPSRLEEARELLEPLFAPLVEVAAPAIAPTECPACHRPLEVEPGDSPIANCYHCGASLTEPPQG